MHQTHSIHTPIGVLLALALTAPGVVFAYDNRDASRDCESRIRSEYGLTDLRDTRATQVEGDKRYRVEGNAKVDGDKYPWTCQIDNRRVVNLEYHGRKPYRASGGGTPEVVPRRSGEVEVRMPGGCTVLYDRDGEQINSGRSCSPGDSRRADDAAASYFREQGSGGSGSRDDRGRSYDDRGRYGSRHHGNAGLDMALSERGSGRVKFDNGCTVFYQNGRQSTASRECSDRQIDRADDAVDDYLR